jgi:uncharacterized protein
MPKPNVFARIENGRTDLVHALLAPDAGALSAEQLANLLQWSSYYGDVTACRLLLSRGASLKTLGDDLGLNAAAFHGHWQLCEFLIEAGASARRADPTTGETPLHSVLSNEDRVRYDLAVEVLLAASADPNAATIPGVPTGAFMRDSVTRGETPLHRAALFGSVTTIRRLLDAGADRERLDAHGESPLAWASWARRPVEVLRLLIYGAHGIHPDYRPLRQNLLGKPMG